MVRPSWLLPPPAALMLVLLGSCREGVELAGDAADDGAVEADPCVPDCEGRSCGGDGCGGVCPPGCAEGEVCVPAEGECAAARGWVEVPPEAPPSGCELAYGWSYAMTYDLRRRVLVAVAGATAPGQHAGTWEYDGTRWTEVTTRSPPSDLFGRAMAYDAARGVVVLVGRRWDAGRVETWEFDGSGWTAVSTPDAPAARSGPAMAYDSSRGVVVLFGGEPPPYGAVLDDTWEYDGITWTEVPAPTRPVGRSEHAMAYDSERGLTGADGRPDVPADERPGPAHAAAHPPSALEAGAGDV